MTNNENKAAPTVAGLTDERIEELWHASGCKVSVDTKAMKFEFARAIEREVRADVERWAASHAAASAVPIRTTLYQAAINCGHSIDENKIVLHRDKRREGNALSQLGDRLDAAYAQPAATPSTAAVRAAEWQPIETAPKDGSAVLLSRLDAGGAWIGKYDPVYPSGYRPDNPWFSLMLNREYLPKPLKSSAPTHWMPIPAAPVPAADGGNGGEHA